MEAALLLRRERSQTLNAAGESDPKKAHISGLPRFGDQVRLRFDLAKVEDAEMDDAGPAGHEVGPRAARFVGLRLPPDELALSAPGAYTAGTGSAEPPWVQAMQRSLVLMHKKQDEVGVQMHQFTAELRETQKRVEFLEEVGAEHRKADAEAEVRQVFEQGGFQDAIHDVWAPYVRTTFMKITLKFPDPEASLATKRAFQTRILQGIKAIQPKSQVLGSEGREVWITKQRAPEERDKIKAIVSTKDFAERYAASMQDI